jgi:peroxiredoxin
MKRIPLLALLALTLIAASPNVGQQAPDFTLLDQNGKPVSLAAARGQKAVIVFYRGYW